MTRLIDSICSIADQFDAIVFDQWGVLHNGTAPYPYALAALDQLKGRTLGILSNSGKRAAPNAARIAQMGFDANQFHTIMTSGEALWRLWNMENANLAPVFPIEGKSGDAAIWASGLSIEITDDVTSADAILLMGLPDGTRSDTFDDVLDLGLANGLPLYCSNPDLNSPRGSGTYVMSPGALAKRYSDQGGQVHLFGKPHRPIFDTMQHALDCPSDRILMVGDSLHHDIKGAQNAGWKSLLIAAGVHAPDVGTNLVESAMKLATDAQITPPQFLLSDLR